MIAKLHPAPSRIPCGLATGMNSDPGGRCGINLHLFTIPLFLILTIGLTWPLLLNIFTAYPSPVPYFGGDPNIYIWFTDWFQKILTHSTPVAPSQMVYYPQGVDPFRAYEAPLYNFLSLPIALLTHNQVLAYNCTILFAFFSSALAAYALVYYLTKSRYASAFGGFIFAFSPYALVRATQHPPLIIFAPLLLLILFTLKFTENPRKKTGFWLAGCVFLTALSSWYYLVAGLIFITIAFLWRLKALLKNHSVTMLTSISIIIGTILPVLPIAASGGQAVIPTTYEYVSKLGAQPLNFFLPHPFTSVFGSYTKEIYETFPSVFMAGPNYFESTSYFGIVLVGLLLALVLLRKKIPIKSPWLWITVFLVFLVLALGVELRIGRLVIHLPYLWLVQYPPFGALRSMNRFFVMVLLAATVLSSYMLKYLKEKLTKKFWLWSVTAALIILFAAERIIFPFPLVTIRVPEFYHQIAADKNVYAIADLPIIFPGYSQYNYFQTIHNKPIVDGEFFYPAITLETISFIEKNPLLAGSICYSSEAPPQGNFSREKILAALRETNIRYLVIHNLILNIEPGCATAREVIHSFFAPLEPVFTDGEITVYSVTNPVRN